MALFVGEFDQAVDEKRRLAIPAALREQIAPSEDGEAFYLVLGSDRHLWLYPDLYYRRLMAKMRRSPFPSRDGQKLSLFWAMARHLKADRQGRMVLPEKSVQRAVISPEVTLVGHDDRIEIWPREDWESHVTEHLPTYGEVLLDASEQWDDGLVDPSHGQ